ncbi:type VII toxin-antitoxin system MntA family adenylyltransferase antitoxin [Pelotomaculum schinkii]|uniref:type VII toxin-antitoxin system MntA family adenylyltransferase antitoxin n=1 Tax=Pelotomaculum schinkii TaxID=78350 RepID=UPI00167E8152|nr:nucleotidyltransferase domain-containing protein [Pelotomaculum schinkii]
MYHLKKTAVDIMQYIPALTEKISMDNDIAAFYLFGSYAEDRQNPASDIDLAVLLDREFPMDSYFDKKLKLLSLATAALKTDEVDFIILNQAPPAFAYQILSKGRLLFERGDKKGQRVDFQVRTFDRYFDFKPVERVVHEGLAKRIKEGRFSG